MRTGDRLPCTGERFFLPWPDMGKTRYEHLHRYYPDQSVANGRSAPPDDLGRDKGCGCSMHSQSAGTATGTGIARQAAEHATANCKSKEFVRGGTTA